MRQARPQILYNDIFDLGVRDDYDPRGSRFMKSIAFKSAEIVTEISFIHHDFLGLNLEKKAHANLEAPHTLNGAGSVIECLVWMSE